MSYGGGNRLIDADEERARNELLFTTERFRNLGRDRTRDLEMIASQNADASADLVAAAYDRNDGDIVNAIMDLTNRYNREQLERELAERQETQEEEVTSESEEEDEDVQWLRGAGRRAALEYVVAHARHLRQDLRPVIPAADVALVVSQARVSELVAHSALMRNNGDIANSVTELTGGVHSNMNMSARGAEAVFASAEAAIGQAEEALAASEQSSPPSLADWVPRPRDWARFAASASSYGNAGYGNLPQLARDNLLDHTFDDVALGGEGNLHDTCNSGILRDLVFPTLEWRVAWARHRNVTPFSQPMLPRWYRAIATLSARWPRTYRRTHPYRGQQASQDEGCDEILWIEYLLAPPQNFDPPGARGRAAQARRSTNVKRLLRELDGSGEHSCVRVRNMIRALVRDTMVNLRPAADRWPDAIWAHALSCCKKWDEECLTMPTAQDLAMVLMSGVQDAAIEAHAAFLEVADRQHTMQELLDAESAYAREEQAAKEARRSGAAVRGHTWPQLEDELEEQVAAAAAAELAARMRMAAEETAVHLAVSSVQETDRRRRLERPIGLTGTRSTLVRDANGRERWTTVVVQTPYPPPLNAEQREVQARITEAREALEAQMERNEMTEGVYLERMNALRDAYNNVRSSSSYITNPGPLGITPRDNSPTLTLRTALSGRLYDRTVNYEPPNDAIPDAD